MAESLGNLSIRIGLSLNELASDFIAAEKSINENMARLAREQQIIKLRAEYEIVGLDPVKDAAKILETQMKSLNQQIASQKDRLKLAQAGLRDTALKTGEFSTQTQRATIAVEREKLALANLEEKLRNIGNQKIQINADALNAQFNKIQSTIDALVFNMNQKNSIIKMRADFELTGLDKAKDAQKILEIQARSLNQQIKNQKSIVSATEKAFREIADKTGKFSSQTLQATANVERQKLALKNLENELRNVSNEQQKLIDQQNAANKNPLLNSYQNFKSDISNHINNISTAFNGLKNATSSADAAITKSLDLINNMTTPLGKTAAALASIPLVLKGVENSILNYTKAAAASGDSVYVMSRGMQLSIAEMGKLSSVCKVTGIDVNEVNSNLRRLETQFVKSGDSGNLMTKMLSQYNVKLTDVNGNLKKGLELSIALADGLKKAQAEGKGAEFISAVGGKFWSGDFVTYLEDLKDNIELAGKIVKNGLANPALAHQVQGNLNAMELQASQLKASFASAFLPVADEIVPRMTARLGDLTKFLADNKDEIKEFGKSVGNFFKAIEDGADMAFSAVKILHDGLKQLKVDPKQKELERNYSSILNPNLDNAKQIMDSYKLSNPAYFAPMIKTLEDTKQQVKNKVEAINQEIGKIGEVKTTNVTGGGGISAQIERNSAEFEKNITAAKEAVKAQQKLSDEIYKITHNEYENKIFDLRKWQQDLLNDEKTTAEQRLLIEKLYAEKSAQIEKERADKIDEIREEIASKNRTDLENQYAQIDKNKKRWIEAGLPEDEAESAAHRQKLEARKRLEQEFADACNAIHQTELEKRLAQIDKEKQAWIQKGIDEVEATRLAEQQKAEAQRNAAMNVLQSQLKEYRIWRDQGEQALRDYQLHQLHKAGISDNDLNSMNPQSLQNFQRAFQDNLNSFLPNFQVPNMMNNPLNNDSFQFKEPLDENTTALNNLSAQIADFQLPDMSSLADNSPIENMPNLNDSISDLIPKFDALAISVSNLTDIIDDLPEINAAEGYNDNDNQRNNLANENPAFDSSSLVDALNNMTSSITETKELFAQFNFSDLTNSISQSTQQIAEAQNFINSIQSDMANVSSKLNDAVSSMSKTTSSLDKVESALNKIGEIKAIQPNIDITQNINEPHAWNNALIQELADRVADKMKNEIIYAIKASYSY